MKLLWFLTLLYISNSLAEDKQWWKHATIYEIFTPSFKDSDGDGYGDLKGVTSKLDYLKELGVDAIWLTPFYPSTMLDSGYDISDYLSIDPRYGTMADFDELIGELRKRGMKLLIDIVINHSSDAHAWFQKSINKVKPYTDFYVWRKPKSFNATGHPNVPNNWLSVFGTSAWTWNEKRKQYYYHAFLPQEPELNLRNSKVKNEIKKIINFWLKKGVAGFRLDSAAWFMEDKSFKDEDPIDPAKRGQKLWYWDMKHDKTLHTNATVEFTHLIRQYVDEFNKQSDTFDRIIIAEVWTTANKTKDYYGSNSQPGIHFLLNFMTREQWDYLNPDNLNKIMDYSIWLVPNNSVPNWQIDGHNSIRSSFKFVKEYIHLLLMVSTLSPGTTFIYYGQEIDMTFGVLRPQHFKSYADSSRTPMQWDGSLNAGFTSKKASWLPTNPNSWMLNVKEQKSDPESTFNFLKGLLELKKTETIKYGDFQKYIFSDWVFVLKRSYKNSATYFIVLNFETENKFVRLKSQIPDVPNGLEVYFSTPNSGFKQGDVVIKKKKYTFKLKPMSGVILRQGLSSDDKDQDDYDSDLIAADIKDLFLKSVQKSKEYSIFEAMGFESSIPSHS